MKTIPMSGKTLSAGTASTKYLDGDGYEITNVHGTIQIGCFIGTIKNKEGKTLNRRYNAMGKRLSTAANCQSFIDDDPRNIVAIVEQEPPVASVCSTLMPISTPIQISTPMTCAYSASTMIGKIVKFD